MKKVFVKLVLCSMLVSSSVTAFAVESENHNHMDKVAYINVPDGPMYSLACECGGRFLVTDKDYSNWHPISKEPCTEHYYGMLATEEMTITTSYSCSNCPRGFASSVKKQRPVHHNNQ